MTGGTWRWCIGGVFGAAVALSIACSSDRSPATGSDAAPGSVPTVAVIPPAYEGSHDVADCSGIAGWVRDRNHPDARLRVDILDGNTVLGTTAADRVRADLRTAAIGDGQYSFTFPLPESLRDGRSHAVTVRISGTSVALPNTPRPATCSASVHIYEGAHDKADCDDIAGWAWDRTRPNTTLDVDIFDGQRRLATVAADRERRDLVDAGFGTGRYGFAYAVPALLHDGRTHDIFVKISGTDVALSSTPKALTCYRP